MSDDDSYLYGGDSKNKNKVKDPRLRRQGDTDFPPPPGTLGKDQGHGGGGSPNWEVRGRRSRSRSRSRSHSPEGRSRRRDYGSRKRSEREDDWKKNTDAFLQNLGAPTAAGTSAPPPMGMAPHPYGYSHPHPHHHGYGVAYPYPGQPPHPHHPGYPPMGYPPMAGAPAVVPPVDERGGRNRTPDMGHHDRQRSGSDKQSREFESKTSKRREEASEGSSASDSENKKETDQSSAKKSGITREQSDKLKEQQKQYLVAKEKLETQLLKLKEQRESLKEDGHVHEDKIMRENAKLQKEVKSRIQYILDVLSKMETALQQPVIEEQPPALPKETASATKKANDSGSSKKAVDKSPSPAETRRVRKANTDDDKSDAEDSDNEESRKKSKKKKKKTKRESSSDDTAEKAKDRKKKKKKKTKSSSDSDSDSDSESSKEKDKDGVIHMDESMFRMMADMKGSKSKKGDGMMMDLLSKMSEAYMVSKKESKELEQRIKALESENKTNKKHMEELKKQLCEKNDKISELEDELEKERSKKRTAEAAEAAEAAEPEGPAAFAPSKKIKLDVSSEWGSKKPLLKTSAGFQSLAGEALEPVKESAREEREDQHRSVRAKMIEQEMAKPRKRQASSSSRSSRSRSKSKSPPRRYSRSRSRSNSRSRSGRRGDDNYRQSARERERERRQHELREREIERERRRREREDYERGRRGGRDYCDYRDRRDRDRHDSSDRSDRSYDRDRGYDSRGSDRHAHRSNAGDRINLDEWRPKHAEDAVKFDPTLASIKEKLKHKQEEEAERKREAEEEERKRQKTQWASVNKEVGAHSEEKDGKSDSDRHPAARPQVNIQWGQRPAKGKTPEPQNSVKRAMPLVGKMPGQKKKTPTPDRDSSPFPSKGSSSRFGPPTTNNTGIPPPSLITNVPAPQPVPPAIPPPMPARAPPKNPVPKNVDINDMIAAAKAHMMARGEGGPREYKGLDMEIPLPPLPAAQDRDPEALKDTRPPPAPVPEVVEPKEKTELEIMLEKHSSDNAGGETNEQGDAILANPPAGSMDYSMFAAYSAHWGPGFDPRSAAVAAAAAASVMNPAPETGGDPKDIPPPAAPEPSAKTDDAKAEEVGADDVDELAMLGIDPSDLTGFGK